MKSHIKKDPNMPQRVLVKVTSPYHLLLDDVTKKLEAFGFQLEKTIPTIGAITGFVVESKFKDIYNLKEVKSINTEPQKKSKTCESEAHLRVYSGEHVGSFPTYYPWICSRCGQMEYQKTNYAPESDLVLFKSLLNKFTQT